jgi:hypothetical protein
LLVWEHPSGAINVCEALHLFITFDKVTHDPSGYHIIIRSRSPHDGEGRMTGGGKLGGTSSAAARHANRENDTCYARRRNGPRAPRARSSESHAGARSRC